MLKAETSCLIVIDIQEKLHKVMYNKDRVECNCVVLVKLAQALGIPILRCEQVPTALGPTIQPVWALLHDEPVFEKTSFSCCGQADFAARLDAVKPTIALLCGIETHVCVYQTARDLLAQGMDVHVIADATTSRTNENKQVALHRLGKEGATLSSTEMCLFELLGDSTHPKFRELAKLIK